MSDLRARDAVVRFEVRDGHTAVVTLNRPEARNAVNGAVAAALEAIVDATEGDPSIRAVVLASSHPEVFCAGADLKEISAGRRASLRTERGGFAGLVFAKRDKPWIVAVDGKALAGGCELVLACDMVVASPRASFGLPEVLRGLIAAAGGLYRLPRALPANIALEMIATALPIDAERAHRFGLVNRLVEPARVLDEALQLASQIAANAPVAVRESLRVARASLDLDETALRQRSIAGMAIVAASEDYQEGPRAFIEKRPPRWSGR
ncbi:enoyl-CoA hydratase-related protein [Variovorax sp. J22R115]|uniref:enoyl-CoA hydratase-related protein n=1 Tax=Variovorax sp. J22R115 TaxID=3053509 RepID=UPI0025769BD2|nr:enoyl-CoA hydratase-related protein [Variovorax sp. J22R115]MDM0047883.1 enoyl-CoA hydratase-related protein [Variovorax sp. J22R115]